MNARKPISHKRKQEQEEKKKKKRRKFGMVEMVHKLIPKH